MVVKYLFVCFCVTGFFFSKQNIQINFLPRAKGSVFDGIISGDLQFLLALRYWSM